MKKINNNLSKIEGRRGRIVQNKKGCELLKTAERGRHVVEVVQVAVAVEKLDIQNMRFTRTCGKGIGLY